MKYTNPPPLGLDRASYNQGQNAKFNFSIYENLQPTLTAKGPGAVMTDYVVRRLTPKECERIQGFPDDWTNLGDWTDSNGKVHKGDSDSPRYKALGNSIATSVPSPGGAMSYWAFVLRRISAQYDYYPTMGSLFDGIGGFPLIWEHTNGIGSTLWASEIEDFPIAVTKKHFPYMQHLGDITKLNGAEIPVVDCIIGGSPCQDLSVAGKRAGLEGERSGLFMEQIRIIKEMRENDRLNGRADEFIRPRYAVWENVLGAKSSNNGEDFKAVLEEFCKVSGGNELTIPKPKKWANNGIIMGDGFSVAFSLHNAASWCVPQNRTRFCVVADFGGESAPEICFERSRSGGNSQPGGEKKQGASADTEGCPDEYH